MRTPAKHSILVTCSHGTVGNKTVQRLAAAGLRLRAGVHAMKAVPTATGNVQPVLCDFDQRASVQRALAGVETALLITPVCPAAVDYAARFIDDARECGVRHVVRLSAVVATSNTSAMLGQWHASTELHLVRSGIAHSILRPTLFMQNFATYYRPDSLGYFYVASGMADANYIDARDVADVAAHLLEHGPRSDGPLMLTGPASLCSSDVAVALSQAAGRQIMNGRITPRQAAVAMRLIGMPGWATTAFRQIHELMCEGFYDCTSFAVLEETGRTPRTIARFASDHKAFFASPGSGWANSLAARLLLRIAPR
jgi:uncharacterized protein YbjT (DUF2867 family)